MDAYKKGWGPHRGDRIGAVWVEPEKERAPQVPNEWWEWERTRLGVRRCPKCRGAAWGRYLTTTTGGTFARGLVLVCSLCGKEAWVWVQEPGETPKRVETVVSTWLGWETSGCTSVDTSK